MILPTIDPDKWVELQAEISGKWLQDHQDVVSGRLYVTQKNGDVTYTDNAQSVFNSIYDKVDDILHMFFIKGDN
tara:strand:+ start:344 stop:565 length:222 start_codon:yes stop_codon:yes gene_type:complete